MTTQYTLDKVLDFIQELTAFYSELSEELPENFLRVVADNTCARSELKKCPESFILSGRGGGRAQQRNYAKFGNQINQKGG